MPQSVVVLNRPGGSGSIGWSYVAGSDDGYRLILMTPEMLVVPLMGIGKVTVGDFQPIARFTDDRPRSPCAPTRHGGPRRSSSSTRRPIPARSRSPTRATAPFLTWPPAPPPSHRRAVGTHSPTAPRRPSWSLLAGDVQATTVAYAELRQHVESGKLRTLAVMSEKRVAGLDAPTLKSWATTCSSACGADWACQERAARRWRNGARCPWNWPLRPSSRKP